VFQFADPLDRLLTEVFIRTVRADAPMVSNFFFSPSRTESRRLVAAIPDPTALDVRSQAVYCCA